ncbi:hypothetical protein AOQ73_05645 [Bradyrhizobium pachyrhizi]|uniref:AAA family ATPase n=1 Tax=Bradyrhizobium pachyrhizi TaxID=280333 RepID=UPI000705657A|nr:AAA family ATPase [Bradyrhizobium pachyrhizi]KRQ11890.1 hypothetical protein AOQ73_05645 [Bradyrhizobium pachyrhizi]
MVDAATFDYYARIGAALFPIPAGQKAPHGIVGSFKHDFSHDPQQWERWQAENPNCNFGLVAFASNLIICDIDIKPIDGQSKEDARNEAWSIWCELCLSWGLSEPLTPYCTSAHGGWHVLCAVPPHVDASTLRQPDAIKKRINVRVIGYTVTAGSYYDGTAKGEESGWYQLFANPAPPHTAPQALIDHCTRVERVAPSATLGLHDKRDVAGLVDWLNGRDAFDAYEDWTAIGMALKLEYGDDGKDIWAHSHNETVTPDVIETKWESFASEPTAQSVTLASFMKRAHELGWTGSLRPSMESMFGGVAQLAASPLIAPSMTPAMPLPEGVPGPSDPAAEEEAEDELNFPTPELHFPETFGDDFIPPDYLVDRILQRRFCYSLTAQTGAGKTTIAMRIAAHVATGRKLGEIDVEQGWVLYFAGENPEDVKMRWFGLTKEMGLDPKKTNVIFIYGTTHLSKTSQRIARNLAARGVSLSLVVVDTAAAYFEGDDDNSNVPAGNHARQLRALCTLPGGPCVLVLCHPTKNAQDDNLVPRGGGAFLNEVDGNIAVRRDGDTVAAAALGKFRGPEFEPVHFSLKVIGNHPRLIDTKGRQIPTIVAEPISAAEHARREDVAHGDELKILRTMCDQPGASPTAIAKAHNWNHSKVTRALPGLLKRGLVSNELGHWKATPKAQKALNDLANAVPAPVTTMAPITPAHLGGAAFPTPSRPVPPPPMPPSN